MGWVKTDFFLGMPMMGFKFNWFLLDRESEMTINFFGNPEAYALPITLLFEQAGIIPKNSRLVGVQHEANMRHVILIFVNKDFEMVTEGMMYPVVDAVVDMDKWRAALATMREAMASVKRQLEEKDKTAVS